MMCYIKDILQLFTFGLQSLQVWMVGSITFQQQMRLLLSFVDIMNMQLLDKTSLFNYIVTMMTRMGQDISASGRPISITPLRCMCFCFLMENLDGALACS